MITSLIRRVPSLAELWARLKCLLWDVITKLILAVLSVAISSEGLRVLNPEFGQKLAKLPIPGAFLLEQDEIGHRLDVAHGLALILVTVVFLSWANVLRHWLLPDEPERHGFDADNYHFITTAIGFLILTADAALFFYGCVQMSWGGGFSVTTLIATVAYVSVVIAVSLVSVELHQRVRNLSRRDKP
jgi:hypothetical protein